MRFASFAAVGIAFGLGSVLADGAVVAGSPASASFTPSAVSQRIVDTRTIGATVDGVQVGIGERPSGTTLEIPVAGRAGVPASAATVAVNLTVGAPIQEGYLTAFPCGAERPVASNLNFRPGETLAAFALVAVGGGGSICVFNEGATHLIVDVAGWFPPGDVQSLPAPRRLLDTRPGATTYDGQHQGTGAPQADSTLRVPVGGRAGVPAPVAAVVLSVTAVDAQAWGFITVHACDEPRPTASHVNFSAGDTIANAVFTPLDPQGEVCLHTSAPSDLVVDVTGWTPANSTSAVVAVPQRILDTRPGAPTIDGRSAGGGIRFRPRTLELAVTGRAGVPDGVGAVLVNVTADSARDKGWITLYPGGSDRPNASHLNFDEGRTIANLAIARLGSDGQMCVFASGRTHVVIDVVGWLPGPPPTPGAGCPETSPPLFPTYRMVAMYGNDVAAVLGVLGEQPPDEAARRLAELVRPYESGDRPVLGAFELIATIATSFPGSDGLYRSPSSPAHVQRYLDAARAHGLYLILDVQPGRSDFLTEVRRYEQFLREPDVGIALDPEWRLGPAQVPGEAVGQVSATEINSVADYLAGLVAEEGIGEKLLVVHQFQDRMVTDRSSLREPPGIALTIHMDGFGTRRQKLSTYEVVKAPPPISNGFKLFFDEDVDMFTPAEVLRLDPSPDVVTYQ